MLYRVKPPAGGCGARGRLVRFWAEHQGGYAGFFGGKLKPPASSEGHVRYFPDHSGNLATAQPFFHRPERIRVASGVDQDHARRVDAELHQGRAV